jgi:hypothetical protein
MAKNYPERERKRQQWVESNGHPFLQFAQLTVAQPGLHNVWKLNCQSSERYEFLNHVIDTFLA